MKCFISREYNLSPDVLNSIHKVLDELQIQYIDMYSENIETDISMGLQCIISNVQMVIGVITKNASNVLYEIGLAIGSGKSVFLLIDNAEDIPTDLYGMTYIKINDNLKENLELPLRFFIDKKRKKPQIDYRRYYKNGLEFESEFVSKDIYLEKLKIIKKNRDGLGFERLVAELFEEIKGQYTTLKFQSSFKDEGYDFAVWIDELSGKIMNPIKFELKIGNLSAERLNLIVGKLAMQTNSQELIIILHCDNSGNEKTYQNLHSNILVIEFEDFLDKIGKYGLAHAIWYFRNLGAHGRDFDNDSL